MRQARTGPVALHRRCGFGPRSTTIVGPVGYAPGVLVQRLHLLPGGVGGAVVLLPQHLVPRANVLPVVGDVERTGANAARHTAFAGSNQVAASGLDVVAAAFEHQ